MPTIRSNLTVPLSALHRVSDNEKMEVDPIDVSTSTRKSTAFRPLSVKCSVFGAQDGSGYAEFGNTKVLAQIIGPDSDGKWEENYAKITVNLKGLDEQKSAEYRAQLTSAVTAIIFKDTYPGKVIDLEITVLSDDGGVLSTAFVAATLAISHSGIENMGIFSSVHVGVDSNGDLYTDPNNDEYNQQKMIGGVTFAFVPNLNQVICFDTYGRIPVEKMRKVMEFSRERAISLVPTLHKAVLNSVKESQK